MHFSRYTNPEKYELVISWEDSAINLIDVTSKRRRDVQCNNLEKLKQNNTIVSTI